MAGFKKAVREDIWLKLLMISPSGGGKSYSSLRVGSGIAKSIKEDTGEEVRIAFIGTEQKRDLYYANEFDYDILQLSKPFTPESYINAIDEALDAGYKIIVIDSLTHEWKGSGGCLEIHSKIPGNSYTAWQKITPRHEAFLDKIIDSQAHVIATVRGKDQYVLEEVNGKQVPRKVALGYDQRDGLEYLFTCSFNIDQDTNIAASVKDNTHLFEMTNKVLDEKDGVKLYEWAKGADQSAIDEIKKSVEDGKKIMKENEEKEAQELNKNRNKSSKKEKPNVTIEDFGKVYQDVKTSTGKSDAELMKSFDGFKNPKQATFEQLESTIEKLKAL